MTSETCALRGLAVVLAMAIPMCLAGEVSAQLNADRWESAIRAFEKQDEEMPPPKHAILFVGSSSIRLWDLPKWFPDRAMINRGFGGSQMADSVRHVDRLVLKHEPRVVVVYAGDNDIASGKSPEQVRDDFREFVEKVHASLPQTKIAYIAIKPSIKRWALVDKVRQANQLIQEVTEVNPRLVFVDIQQPMLGDDGMPRKQLFVADGLHLSDEGYGLWSALLLPHLKSD